MITKMFGNSELNRPSSHNIFKICIQPKNKPKQHLVQPDIVQNVSNSSDCHKTGKIKKYSNTTRI